MQNLPHLDAVMQACLADRSVTKAAALLSLVRTAVSRTLHGHARIFADRALRLSELLGTRAQLCLGLKSACDVWHTKQQARTVVQPVALKVTHA